MARVSRATAAKSRATNRQDRQASERHPSINTLRSEQEQDDKHGLTFKQWLWKGELEEGVGNVFGGRGFRGWETQFFWWGWAQSCHNGRGFRGGVLLEFLEAVSESVDGSAANC